MLKIERNLEGFVSYLCTLEQNKPHIGFAELMKKGIDRLSADPHAAELNTGAN